jgi:hypothetical protein
MSEFITLLHVQTYEMFITEEINKGHFKAHQPVGKLGDYLAMGYYSECITYSIS